MTSSLLLSTAVAAPAAPVVAGAAESAAAEGDSAATTSFTALLDLAAAMQWQGEPPDESEDIAASEPESESESEPTSESTEPAVMLTELPVALMLPTERIASPVQQAVAQAIGIGALGGDAEQTDAAAAELSAALPLTGKRLPAELLVRQPLVRLEGAAEPVGDTSVETALSANDAIEGWSVLLEQASKTSVGLLARPESVANATLTARATAEPALAIFAAGPASATASHATNEATQPVPGLNIRSPHFDTLLGNQLLWQAKVGNQQAEIRLDPPELGPIEVRISQSDNETHLHFVVSHQATRDQLEQALPRLRELFGQGGLLLGQVEVEQGRRDQEQGAQQSNASRTGKTEDDGVLDQPVMRQLSGSGLIDDFA